jgi:hypothetical protein
MSAEDPPTTIAEFLDRARTAYEGYSRAIAALPADSLTQPGMVGDWSVRDVIAHVGGDELWMAGQLEALHLGTLPTAASCYGIDAPLADPALLYTQDGRNAWQRERLRNLSLDDVRAMAAEAHARLLAIVSSFDDAAFGRPLAIGNLGTVGHIREPTEGEPAYPLWEWLRGVTYHHYADHAEALRLLAPQSGGGTLSSRP